MPIDEPLYPVSLRLAGHRCLVVGGGERALGPVLGLLAAGAKVQVIAPDVLDSIAVLRDVSVQRRPYRRGDVSAFQLAITTTRDAEIDQTVIDDGETAGVLVTSVAVPDRGAFVLPSVVRRGRLLVTVDSGGQSPAFSEWMHQWLNDEIGPEYETLLEVVSEVSDEMISRGEPTDGSGWQFALDSGMLELVRAGRVVDAKERLRRCLSS